MTYEEVKFDLKRGMNAWVLQNTTLTEFSNALGYRYQNAWGLLRGKVPVTVETVGRFVLAYGTAATYEMLDLAGLKDTQEVRFENGTPSVYSRTASNEPVYAKAEEVA